MPQKDPEQYRKYKREQMRQRREQAKLAKQAEVSHPSASPVTSAGLIPDDKAGSSEPLSPPMPAPATQSTLPFHPEPETRTAADMARAIRQKIAEVTEKEKREELESEPISDKATELPYFSTTIQLPDCTVCGNCEWEYSPDMEYFICPCGNRILSRPLLEA